MTVTDNTLDTVSTKGPGIAGVLSGVAFVMATMMIKWPGGSDTNEVAQKYLADDGNQSSQIIAGFLIALAGLLFLWFVSGLLRRVVGFGANVAAGAATATATLLVGGGFVSLAMAETYSSDSSSIDTVGSLGWAAEFLVMGGVFASAVVALLAAVSAFRGRALPTWFGALSILALVCCLASMTYVSMWGWALWVIVGGVLLLVRGDRSGILHRD